MKLNAEARQFLQDVLIFPLEICGSMEKKNGEYVIKEYTQGSNIPRQHCNYSILSRVVFHTHPLSSKSYPSIEDLAKVVKYPQVKVWLLACKWGIWYMRVSSHKLNSDFLQKVNDRLYHITNSRERPELNSQILQYIYEKYIPRVNQGGVDLHLEIWGQEKR